jgi:class 3 adenylate cyclase/tetratricopeptide (TPR) repeat protein
VRCPQCGHDNPEAAKFCGECGTRFGLVCLSCGTSNAAASKFCNECGQRLAADATVAGGPGRPGASPAPPDAVLDPLRPFAIDPRAGAPGEAAPARPIEDRFASAHAYTPKHLAEKILVSAGAIEGERKQVTVLFTDISGFTSLASRLDPEAVHEIMDRCFEIILASVHAYEGTVNQFLGDGVMALFGAPIAHEDHAHRALRAALGIRAGLEPLRDHVQQRHGIDFRVRVGINTGPVVVGAIGRDLRMDYTAVGDTTNLASRILNVAEPGEIALSANTHRLTNGYFDFADLGEFPIKGKPEPVRVWTVSAELSGRTRLEVSRERGLTPLIGRNLELERLTTGFRQAATGNGAIVMLIGEPGVGKSRLIYEFLRRLDGQGVLELEGTGVSYGQAIPYRPILELVRRYLTLKDGMPPEEIRQRVVYRLRALGLEGDEPAALLAHFLGIPAPPPILNRLSGAQLKERTFGALRDLFFRASQDAPLVLVVENIHWLDPSSEEFVQYFARALPGHRVLLVLSGRPGSAPPWLAALRADTLTLPGLDDGEIRHMTRSLIQANTLAAPLAKILDDKSEGNPLYVEEILRELQETSGIVVENGEARLRSEAVAVPATIHDIIAARVDRLTDPLKRTLQGAAVIGRRSGVSLLSRVIEIPWDQTIIRLGELHRLDFVFPSVRDPEPMYSFRHALTQDVVYGGLLERRRRQYHVAAGLGFETLYASRLDDVVELLAYHYGRSGESEKAVDYAIRAGEKAQKRWATTEALEQFESALWRLDTMERSEANRRRRIDAVLKQSEIKFALGRHAEHVQALEAIREIVETSADPARQAAWHCWTGFLHSLTGARPEVPIALCRKAVEIAEKGGFPELRAFAECCLTHVYVVSGDLREAIEAGERALVVFEAHHNAWWACRTLFGLSMAANALGEWPRGLEYCRRVVEYGRDLDDLRLKVVGLWRSGSTHIQRGDIAQGLRCCEDALALSPVAFDAVMTKVTQGYGLINRGDVAEGVAQLEAGVAWFRQSNLAYTHAFSALWLVEGYLRLERQAEARALLEDVLATARDRGYPHVEGVATRLLAEACMEDDPAAAAKHFESATALLDRIGARNQVAKALEKQAALRRAAGDRSGAEALLARARTLFETLGTIDAVDRVRESPDR